MKRILVVLGIALTSGLLVTPAAQAGNWEETLLDPTPALIEQGVTYTFGYWVLQHGSYPFDGELGPTALLATDQKGEEVEFAGMATATAGHYSAEVVFPHDGTWTIRSKHQVLMEDALVATVTVPGSVAIAPSDMKERAPYDWGKVQPSFPAPAPNAANMPAPPAEGAVAKQTPAEVAPRSHEAAVDESGTQLPVWVAVYGGVAVLGLPVWLGRRHLRTNANR